MTDNETTKGELTAEKELTGKEKSLLNLKPINAMTEQEKHEFALKGNRAKAEKARQRKTMQESMLAWLDTKCSREFAEKYLGPDAERLPEGALTMQDLMNARMWKEATEKGNARAAEFVRDTSGQKMKEQLSITAETMTEADRSLMANIAERLGIKAD